MWGSEGFGGDNLTFRKTKGEISRNCEPKKGRLLKTLKGFRGEGGGGGPLKFAWTMMDHESYQ